MVFDGKEYILPAVNGGMGILSWLRRNSLKDSYTALHADLVVAIRDLHDLETNHDEPEPMLSPEIRARKREIQAKIKSLTRALEDLRAAHPELKAA